MNLSTPPNPGLTPFEQYPDQRVHTFVVAGLTLLLLLSGCTHKVASTGIDTVAVTTADNWLEPAHITQSLRSVASLYPVRPVAAAAIPSRLHVRVRPIEIEYLFGNTRHTIAEFVERTDTTGLLILRGDTIVYEGYYRGANPQSRFLSMSMAKSFTATLVGIAREQGLIKSFDDVVQTYLPEFSDTGYANVSIRDLLQMASGIDFTEVYEDGESDIARLGAACFGGPEKVTDLLKTYGRKRRPGTVFEYASADTLVLGLIVRRVTGQPLADFMSEYLWQPMGAESSASWAVDPDGVECALGGLNATLRDYARFGALMARDGTVAYPSDGNSDKRSGRVLPVGWVAEATIPGAPHVQPGKLYPGYPLGYQYQWWTFPDRDHSFVAEGIHGQLLMVNPVLDLVMVKTSAWTQSWDDNKEAESWALWQAAQDWARLNPE